MSFATFILFPLVAGLIYFSVKLTKYSWKQYFFRLIVFNIVLILIQFIIGELAGGGEAGMFMMVTIPIQILINIISLVVFGAKKTNKIKINNKHHLVGLVLGILSFIVFYFFLRPTTGSSTTAIIQIIVYLIISFIVGLFSSWIFKIISKKID